MARGAAIVISILANASQANATLNTTATRVQKVGNGFRKMAAPAGVALAAVTALAKGTIDAGSDAEQSIGATESVFKKYASTVIADSKKAASALGLPANEYRELNNVMGSMLKSSGMPLKQVTGLTADLTARAADLAATFGGDTSEAVQAISSLLRGEADPIERYGVSIKQADVNARLAAQGQDKLTGAAKKQAEQQARLDLLFRQTGDAQGQFARESDTSANKAQKNAAHLANLRAEIGTRLLPAYVTIQEKIATVIDFLSRHQSATIKVGIAIASLAGFVLGVNAAMSVASAVTATYTAVTAASAAVQRAAGAAALGTRLGLAALAIQTVITSAATKAAAAAQWLMNAAMSANPIGLIVIAIAAFVAALILAYKKSETFRTIVNAAFAGAKAIISSVMGWVRANVPKAWAVVVAGVKAYINVYKTVIVTAFNIVRSVIQSVGSFIAGAVSFFARFASGVRSKIGEAVSFIRSIPGKITSALGNLGGLLLGAGRQVIQGLLDGIESMIGNVRSKLQGITDLIPDWKGPKARDKKLLTPVGKLIMQGLIKGFDEGTAGVKKTLDGITKLIGDRLKPKRAKVVLQGLRDEYNAIRKNASAWEKNNAKLADARKRLEDLKKVSADYAASVKQSIVSYGNIANLGEGHMNNPGSMVAALKAKVAQAKRYADLIKQLTGKLNKTSLQQLIDEGVEGGMAAAEALVAGGPKVIGEVNSLTAELAKTGASLGSTTAAHFHNAGIQAAQGLVNGLASQSKTIEKLGKKLAKTLLKAVKKELKIKSPSRKFKDEVMGNVVRGLDVKPHKSYVKRQGLQLAKSLETGFSRGADLSAQVAWDDYTSGEEHRKLTVTLTSDQISQLERGRKIALDLDEFYKQGGRRAA